MSGGRPLVLTQLRLAEDLRARLEADFEVLDVPSGEREALRSATAAGWLADGSVRVDQAVIDGLPSLRMIAADSVGTDFIDLAATSAAGVRVSNAAGTADDAVAELALGLILALGRDIVDSDAYCRDGRWRSDGPDARLSTGVHDSTVGILGMGRIGRRLGELLAPLRVRTVYHNRRPSPESDAIGEWLPREELLRVADYVVLLLPLTEETRGSFGAAELGVMRTDARLVNLGRGAVVDSAALADALRRGAIAGAALDVMEQEPLPAGSELLAAPGLILQPHVGSATPSTRRSMRERAVAELRRGLLGLPLESEVG
ncbi:MAG: hypothetical protein KF727_03275 [Microbacteriaceae bacterium]|nr:hypothetical protein [Microbacteriaceae bacterium]